MSTYQVQVAPIGDTLAHYIAWGQSFGGAFTTFGWSPQSGHGEVVASGTGGSYAWTTVTLPTTALTAQVNYNFKGAFVPSTTYTGSNVANAANVDVVTSGGVTYAHITASSSLATAPGSDTTNWQPLIFEIWKSNGSNTSSLPIYVKFVYTIQTSAGSGIRQHMTIGTGVDANGNLTGAITLAASAPVTVASIDNSSTTSSTVFDMDFSGDADNIRWINFRGSSAGFCNVVVIDRSKTASGTDTDAYFYVGSCLHSAGTSISRSSVVLKTALGTFTSVSANGWCGSVFNGTSASASVTTSVFGSTPPFPIFPIVGYVANPLLGCVGFNKGDNPTDGSVIPVWIYGATHNYLVQSIDTASGSTLSNVGTNGVQPAILWE